MSFFSPLLRLCQSIAYSLLAVILVKPGCLCAVMVKLTVYIQFIDSDDRLFSLLDEFSPYWKQSLASLLDFPWELVVHSIVFSFQFLSLFFYQLFVFVMFKLYYYGARVFLILFHGA